MSYEHRAAKLAEFCGPLEDGLAYYGLPKSYNSDPKNRRVNYSYWEYDSNKNVVYSTPQKSQAIEKFSQPHFELLNDWNISPKVTLHNTLFYIEGNGYFDYDGDWAAYPDAGGNPTPAIEWFRNYVGYSPAFGDSVFPTLIFRGFVGNRQWGWLPNVEIDHGSGKLTVGAELGCLSNYRIDVDELAGSDALFPVTMLMAAIDPDEGHQSLEIAS